MHGGKIWFTDANNNTYGVLDPTHRQREGVRVEDAGSIPYGMRAAPDGSVWIAFLGTNKLGRVDTTTRRGS